MSNEVKIIFKKSIAGAQLLSFFLGSPEFQHDRHIKLNVPKQQTILAPCYSLGKLGARREGQTVVVVVRKTLKTHKYS